AEALLNNADQAMYAAKAAGRNRSCYFTLSMQEQAQTRLRLVNDLHLALDQSQFSLDFQPLVDLASGRIAKAETLLRWRRPRPTRRARRRRSRTATGLQKGALPICSWPPGRAAEPARTRRRPAQLPFEDRKCVGAGKGGLGGVVLGGRRRSADRG
ncbi:hypothetical protein ACWKWV_14565, partial [Castellaniella ginsengisoli]